MNTQERMTPYHLFIFGLSVYVLIALMAMTFFQLDAKTMAILEDMDFVVCLVFLLDFGIMLATARSKLAYLKWGWLDLLASIPMLDVFRWGRLARVLRVLRILRAARATKTLALFVTRRRAEGTFAGVAFISLLLVVFSSIAILQCETGPESNIKTGEDALWWAFVTITTVGYGEKYPATTAGHIVAAVLIVAGVGLFGTFTGFVASWFLQGGEKRDGPSLAAIQEQLGAIRAKLDALEAREAGVR